MHSMLKYKPIHRTSIRLRLGKAYYRARRYVKWIKMRSQFASMQNYKQLPYRVASHHTPLYRELHQVDRSIQGAKVHNLRIAVKQLHGIVLQPGEVFSY